MVVKPGDGTDIRTLTPRRTYEDDAVSARFAVFQQNLKKKQQPPRFAGGIWDVDGDMDNTKSSVVANSLEFRHQLNAMLLLESPYMDIEDRMDTGETSRRDSSHSMSSIEEQELDETLSKMAIVQENKGNSKKKSTEESSIERSKRCCTSLKTEVYALQPPLGELQIGHETQPEMLAEHKPFKGATAEAICPDVENHLPQDLNSVGSDKEPQIDTIKKTEGSGSAAKTAKENLYRKEIADLRRVTSVIENLVNNDADRCETYSEDVKHLQSICMKLQNMVDANIFQPTSAKLDNPQNDCKSATNRVVTGVVAYTVQDEIHRNVSCKTEASGTEYGDSILEKTMNGTLPWQPLGSPPKAIAFGSSTQTIDNHNIIHPPTVQSSMSSVNGSMSTEQLLHFKLLALQAKNINTNPSMDETSRDKTMDIDSDFKQLSNKTLDSESRGSPPQNSVNSGSCKERTSQYNYQRSSQKASDMSASYVAKDTKPKPVIKYPVKGPEATSSRYIPPHLRPKSTWKSDIDVSTNPQDQGFRKRSWQNWRKEESHSAPINNLSCNGSKSYNNQASKLNDNYKRQPPNEKVLNNVKSTIPGSDSEPSVTPFKPNSTANNYRTRHNSNSEKFLNNPGSDTIPSPHTYKPNGTTTANNYRTRHNSNSEKFFSKTKSYENLNTMISVKIFDDQNGIVDELMVDRNLLDQRRKLFKNLFEVVPMYNEKDKVLALSGSAVQTFLRSVFSLTYKIRSWEIALESYYLAKKYGFTKLQEDCKQYFNNKPIYPNQVQGIVRIAQKFQINDVLTNSKMFAEVQEHKISRGEMAVTTKEPKCTVSCAVYSEPSAFYVPLTCNEEPQSLGSRRESDIKNDIIFESLSGTFSLVKLQIKLEVESKDLGKEVDIFVDFFKNDRKLFDLERRKRLNKLMIIDFKQRLLVEQGEIVTISILIEDACTGMCPCLIREKEVGICPGNGSFEVTFATDAKSEARQPLFFVEKLFYTFEGQKN